MGVCHLELELQVATTTRHIFDHIREKKEMTCRDQDSNLGYYGHNVMS